MNDKFFLAVSLRIRLKNKNKYLLGRLTTAKEKMYFSWKVSEESAIRIEDSLSLNTARKYNLQTFPNKQMIKDLRSGIGEYFRKNNRICSDAFVTYFKNYVCNKYDYKQEQIDWSAEIIGKIS